ncbi:hypothetical protein [Vagococcus fluvialis]|uniref:Uncharacterized protein n=1 Tax=Vagococcus fluvialis TaxID=2738 RepID=A0A7X6DBI3_9ENTE|nr:hypothetical protein [Vagococcus fluvialis]NKC69330.1 hypothetical protein [Vagococcus fluvialis]
MEYYDTILYNIYTRCKAKFTVNWYVIILMIAYIVLIPFVFIFFTKPNIKNLIILAIASIIFILVFVFLIIKFNKSKNKIKARERRKNKKRIVKINKELKENKISNLRVTELINVYERRVDFENKKKEKTQNISITIFILTSITFCIQSISDIFNLEFARSNKIIDLEIKKFEEIKMIGDNYDDIVKLIDKSYSQYIQKQVMYVLIVVFILLIGMYLYRMIVISFGASNWLKSYNEKILEDLYAVKVLNSEEKNL